MIDKINNNPVQQFIRGTSAEPQNNTSGISPNSVTTSVSFEKLITQAQQMDTEDNQAVQNARNLLLSGQLDTPENIKKAAENIVKFGI